MTYFGFLLRFLVIPIVLLGIAHLFLRRRGKSLPESLQAVPPGLTLAAHILVALIYTTPWDNYLVATGVWYYNPELVNGLVLGWVPIEEYTFFVLQPILTGLWLFLLAMVLDLGSGDSYAKPRLRLWSVIILGVIWLLSVVVFIADWAPGTYLSITLAWALPPILLQLAIGADILWRYRRLIFWSLVPMTVYLSFADSFAIGDGTWAIAPAQSLNVYIGGVLPIEEFIFFFLTNTLLVFGITLVMARESHSRLYDELIPWVNKYLGRKPDSAKTTQ